MTEITKKALTIAATQVGQDEKPHGSNWGEPVKSYLASVGIGFPASWCMAFVYWCYKQTGDTVPLFKTGGVLMQLNKRAANAVKTPAAGDVFIMDHGYGLGHTGFVEKVEGVNIFTIEGNTNDTGSREGIEVCRRKRPLNTIKAFLRF